MIGRSREKDRQPRCFIEGRDDQIPRRYRISAEYGLFKRADCFLKSEEIVEVVGNVCDGGRVYFLADK